MPALQPALDALHAGDAAALTRLLDADPALVAARVASRDGHYCGYFYRATLLHHVAGNPSIRPLPPNTVALATLLLDRGAEVDAATEAGPSQPDDIGWSALGLVATSDEARRGGHQAALLELLVARGADVDFRDGGPLMGALYYSEQDAARWLVERGARVDLVAAAGLGRIELMAQHGEHTLVHYCQRRGRPTTRAEVLSLALCYASLGGHGDAVAWLLDQGASPSERAPFDHDATPLHWAALHDRADVVALLLARGADRTVRDRTYDATPSGWAAHNGHAELASTLA